MTARFVDEVLAELTLRVHSTPSAFEFEMAYQSRIVCDRLRFVIKNVEAFGRGSGPMRETCLQLMDALRRLENIDRRFQSRSVSGSIAREK